MRQPVICHLANFAPEYGGSFVDSLLQLASDCWKNERIRTLCIFPTAARSRSWLTRFDAQGIKYEFVPRTRQVLANVQPVLREYDPVVLHTHYFLYDLCSVLLKIMCHRKTKVIWHYRNPTPSALPQRIKLQLVARYFADKCIAVGDDVYHSLLAAGLPAERAALIHNGINVKRFASNDTSRRLARQFLRVSTEDTVFLLLGLDPFRKGVDIYIKAVSELALRRSQRSSIFIVLGRQNTRKFMVKLPECPASGSSVRVIDPIEDFGFLLSGIDVLVSCSRREAFGYAIAEAMAAGKLVLSSDAPGMREIYGAAAGVWFFPREDTKGLADLMSSAEELSCAERRAIGVNNARYVHERYSIECWANKIRTIYHGMLH